MSQPAKPKALKPNADAAADSGASPAKGNVASGGSPLQLVLLLAAIVLGSTLGPALAMYFLGPMVLVPAITAALPQAAHGEGEADGEHADGAHGDDGSGGAHQPLVGMNLGLTDFTVNLRKDPNLRGTQYLRTKVSLSVKVPEAEDCVLQAAHGDAHAEGGGGGGHGAAPAADPMVACQEAFDKKLAVYVPTIRDIVNTSLMKRSASDIASLEGQELLKDDVIRDVNALMAGTPYKVLRVNLQEFVVQQ
jgi:flagellar basal body-associated protein FliL